MLFCGADLSKCVGGFFKALMTFPKDYPNMPPKMRFTSDMWHPNSEVLMEPGSLCSLLEW